MAKYKVEVGSFVTRLVIRDITVNAKNEEEARIKAIDKYIDLETKIESSVDFGSPKIDSLEKLGS